MITECVINVERRETPDKNNRHKLIRIKIYFVILRIWESPSKSTFFTILNKSYYNNYYFKWNCNKNLIIVKTLIKWKIIQYIVYSIALSFFETSESTFLCLKIIILYKEMEGNI